ncbi:helix-turn-helix transcriptional regulator [Rathayibacter sp. VKM Ac-2835]|uniref:helix-turn-helix domain-containing protein n=1 Tax=Rathayibacter sp. VKM Ac-2835 TaxID=2739043 RepID=UPI001565D78A|nr:helix-turn-helix transcriptional regulator [Rathayibacter sp. VKM Ac-2835]NRG42603.1 helix-turn-helix transcriptional regulator [Rathayibacter sp. VKM Ac-2835]
MPRPLRPTTDDARRLGAHLRGARVERGIRQEDLARCADIGTATLRRIETGGQDNPSLFVIVRLLDQLDLPMATLDTILRHSSRTEHEAYESIPEGAGRLGPSSSTSEPSRSDQGQR